MYFTHQNIIEYNYNVQLSIQKMLNLQYDEHSNLSDDLTNIENTNMTSIIHMQKIINHICEINGIDIISEQIISIDELHLIKTKYDECIKMISLLKKTFNDDSAIFGDTNTTY